MPMVKEERERIVIVKVDVAVCDQCGTRQPADEQHGYPEIPDGWIRVLVVGTPHDPLNPQAGHVVCCSWTCASSYALAKAQVSRIAVAV
jgi:hypothetical protein